MRIGIDARFLTHPQRGGFKTYTENLIRAILDIDHENRYMIYIDRSPVDEQLSLSENVNYRIVSGEFPVIGMPLREQLSLRMQINRDRPDILHFLCNTAPITVKTPYVLTLHDTIQIEGDRTNVLTENKFDIKSWVIRKYSKWAIQNAVKSACRIIAVSGYEKANIARMLDISPEKIKVIYNAPSPIYAPVNQSIKNKWRLDLQNSYGVRCKYLLSVGYEPRKNIPLLIRAFSLVIPELSDLILVIVVSNDERRFYFRKLVEELNLSNRVVILGKVPDQDLVKLYNLAEIFIFPSEREGFGLPPLEAIACGTPTIAMNLSSLPEILEDGALFINAKEPEVWAQAIKRVLTEDDLRAELIAKGLQHAAKFSWQKCAQETILMYQQVYQESR